MSKNYMEQVAQMLGVEMGEKFKIEDFKDHKFYISENGLQCKGAKLYCTEIFTDLIAGQYKVTKAPQWKHTGLEDVEANDPIYMLFGRSDGRARHKGSLSGAIFSDETIRNNWERYIVIKKHLAKAASELNTEPIDWDENKPKWYICCDPKDNNNLTFNRICKGPEDAIYFNKAEAAKKAIEIVGKDDLIWMLRDFQAFIGYSREAAADE